MIDLKNIDDVKTLQSNLRAAFGSPQGQEAMKFMEQIGGWYPTMLDSEDTNAIISRDANRRLLGTLKTLMDLQPEQVVGLAIQTEDM